MKIKMNKLDKVSKISKDIVTPKNLNSSNFTVVDRNTKNIRECSDTTESGIYIGNYFSKQFDKNVEKFGLGFIKEEKSNENIKDFDKNKEAEEVVYSKINYRSKIKSTTAEKTKSLYLGENIHYDYDSLNNINNNLNKFTAIYDNLRFDNTHKQEQINDMFFENQKEKLFDNEKEEDIENQINFINKAAKKNPENNAYNKDDHIQYVYSNEAFLNSQKSKSENSKFFFYETESNKESKHLKQKKSFLIDNEVSLNNKIPKLFYKNYYNQNSNICNSNSGNSGELNENFNNRSILNNKNSKKEKNEANFGSSVILRANLNNKAVKFKPEDSILLNKNKNQNQDKISSLTSKQNSFNEQQNAISKNKLAEISKSPLISMSRRRHEKAPFLLFGASAPRREAHLTHDSENFAEKSLNIFPRTSKLRLLAFRSVQSTNFEITILTLIFINSVLLSVSFSFNLNNTAEFDFFDFADFFFLFLYAVEALMKILAWGLYAGKKSYLRSSWNILDFFVLSFSFVCLIPFFKNFEIFKLFRMLRPLRTIAFFPGLRKLVTMLAESIKQMLSLFYLMLFFFLLFGVFGTTIWAGLLTYRCRAGTAPFGGLWPPIADSKQVCSGSYACPKNSTCASLTDFYDKSGFFFAPKLDFYAEQRVPELNYGFTNFDNILEAVLTIFQAMTLEGWSSIMYIVQNGYNYYSAAAYFISIALVMNYFVLNFTIAIMMNTCRNLTFSTDVVEDEVQLEKKLGGDAANRIKLKLNFVVLFVKKFLKFLKEIRFFKKFNISDCDKDYKNVGFGNANGNWKGLSLGFGNGIGRGKSYNNSGGSFLNVNENKSEVANEDEKKNKELNENKKSHKFISKTVIGTNANGSNINNNKKMNFNSTANFAKSKSDCSLDSSKNNENNQKNPSRSKDENENKKNNKNKNNNILTVKATENKKNEENENKNEINKNNNSNNKANSTSETKQPKFAFHKKHKFLFYCFVVSKQPIFQYIIYLMVVTNVFVLALNDVVASAEAIKVYDFINNILILILSIELLLKLCGHGFFNFIKKPTNIFDFLITALSIYEFSNSKKSSFGILRVIRLYRLIKLTKNWKTLSIIIKCIRYTTKEILNYLILITIMIYVYALIGVTLFKDKLKFRISDNEFDVVKGISPYLNFDDIFTAFISVFTLLIGDDWHLLMYDCLRSPLTQKRAVYAYFISVVVLLNIVMMNLVIAFLVFNFESARKRFLYEEQMRKWLLELKSVKGQRSYSFSFFNANLPIRKRLLGEDENERQELLNVMRRKRRFYSQTNILVVQVSNYSSLSKEINKNFFFGVEKNNDNFEKEDFDSGENIRKNESNACNDFQEKLVLDNDNYNNIDNHCVSDTSINKFYNEENFPVCFNNGGKRLRKLKDILRLKTALQNPFNYYNKTKSIVEINVKVDENEENSNNNHVNANINNSSACENAYTKNQITNSKMYFEEIERKDLMKIIEKKRKSISVLYSHSNNNGFLKNTDAAKFKEIKNKENEFSDIAAINSKDNFIKYVNPHSLFRGKNTKQNEFNLIEKDLIGNNYDNNNNKNNNNNEFEYIGKTSSKEKKNLNEHYKLKSENKVNLLELNKFNTFVKDFGDNKGKGSKAFLAKAEKEKTKKYLTISEESNNLDSFHLKKSENDFRRLSSKAILNRLNTRNTEQTNNTSNMRIDINSKSSFYKLNNSKEDHVEAYFLNNKHNVFKRHSFSATALYSNNNLSNLANLSSFDFEDYKQLDEMICAKIKLLSPISKARKIILFNNNNKIFNCENNSYQNNIVNEKKLKEPPIAENNVEQPCFKFLKNIDVYHKILYAFKNKGSKIIFKSKSNKSVVHKRKVNNPIKDEKSVDPVYLEENINTFNVNEFHSSLKIYLDKEEKENCEINYIENKKNENKEKQIGKKLFASNQIIDKKEANENSTIIKSDTSIFSDSKKHILLEKNYSKLQILNKESNQDHKEITNINNNSDSNKIFSSQHNFLNINSISNKEILASINKTKILTNNYVKTKANANLENYSLFENGAENNTININNEQTNNFNNIINNRKNEINKSSTYNINSASSNLLATKLNKKNNCNNASKNFICKNIKSKAKKYFFKFLQYISESSLFIFHQKMRLRRLLIILINKTWFEYLTVIIIFLSCIVLLLESPFNNPNSTYAYAIKLADQIFTFIFFFEMIAKVIAYGFLFNNMNKIENIFEEFGIGKDSFLTEEEREDDDAGNNTNNGNNLNNKNEISNKNLVKLKKNSTKIARIGNSLRNYRKTIFKMDSTNNGIFNLNVLQCSGDNNFYNNIYSNNEDALSMQSKKNSVFQLKNKSPPIKTKTVIRKNNHLLNLKESITNDSNDINNVVSLSNSKISNNIYNNLRRSNSIVNRKKPISKNSSIIFKDNNYQKFSNNFLTQNNNIKNFITKNNSAKDNIHFKIEEPLRPNISTEKGSLKQSKKSLFNNDSSKALPKLILENNFNNLDVFQKPVGINKASENRLFSNKEELNSKKTVSSISGKEENNQMKNFFNEMNQDCNSSSEDEDAEYFNISSRKNSSKHNEFECTLSRKKSSSVNIDQKKNDDNQNQIYNYNDDNKNKESNESLNDKTKLNASNENKFNEIFMNVKAKSKSHSSYEKDEKAADSTEKNNNVDGSSKNNFREKVESHKNLFISSLINSISSKSSPKINEFKSNSNINNHNKNSCSPTNKSKKINDKNNQNKKTSFNNKINLISSTDNKKPALKRAETKLTQKPNNLPSIRSILFNSSGGDSLRKSQENEVFEKLMQKAYLRDIFNIIDFIVIIGSIIYFLNENSTASSETEISPTKTTTNTNTNTTNEIFQNTSTLYASLRALRALRALRPLRMISKLEELKIVVYCLVMSTGAIFYMFLIGCFVLFIYSLVGMNLFSGTLGFCSGKSLGNRLDCVEQGAVWTAYAVNFDTLGSSMLTLFQMATASGWVETMRLTIKSNGGNRFISLYFLSFMVIGCIFIMNLAVTVIVDNFSLLNKHAEGISLLTEDQQNWVKTMKYFLKYKPVPHFDLSKMPMLRRELYLIVNKKAFNFFVNFLILINVLLLFTQTARSNAAFEEIQSYFFYFSILCFNLEMLIRLYVFRKLYFIDNWNKFDLIVVILSNASIILNIIKYFFYDNFNDLQRFQIIPVLIRGIRILRVLRLINLNESLKGYFYTFVVLFPSLVNIGSLILIILTIYAVIGMNFFSLVIPGENINSNINFQSFVSSLLALIRVTTGDNWTDIMNELAEAKKGCRDTQSWAELVAEGPKGCGGNISYWYFLSFVMLNNMVIFNLFIAVVVESFMTHTEKLDEVVEDKVIFKFYQLWGKYDRDIDYRVYPWEFVLLMLELGEPLGIRKEFFHEPGKTQNYYTGNIYFSHDCVHYADDKLCIKALKYLDVEARGGFINIIDAIKLICRRAVVSNNNGGSDNNNNNNNCENVNVKDNDNNNNKYNYNNYLSNSYKNENCDGSNNDKNNLEIGHKFFVKKLNQKFFSYNKQYKKLLSTKQTENSAILVAKNVIKKFIKNWREKKNRSTKQDNLVNDQLEVEPTENNSEIVKPKENNNNKSVSLLTKIN